MESKMRCDFKFDILHLKISTLTLKLNAKLNSFRITSNLMVCEQHKWKTSRRQNKLFATFIYILLSCAVVARNLSSVSAASVNYGPWNSNNNFTDIDVVDDNDENEINVDRSADRGAFVAASATLSSSLSKGSSGCPPSASQQCLRCNIDGCIKCPAFLVTDTRKCVETCPSGYTDHWSSHPDLMGRVCISKGFSPPLMAALAGLLGAFFVCLSLLAVGIIVIKRKHRRKTIKEKLINESTMDHSDFLRQLEEMRPNAEYFLAMLNDTRRQIRKLYLSGEASAANSYRPIVRDLAKILILLNRPIELITAPPHDWNRIHSWSERALERYKPQVGQLIDFFQSPTINNGDGRNDSSLAFNNQTIFKSSSIISSSNQAQKMQLFGSLISLHEFDEPRSSDPFGSSFNTLKGSLITDLNTSSLWLEDEFFKLGFRPQDEITTEL